METHLMHVSVDGTELRRGHHGIFSLYDEKVLGHAEALFF